MFILISSGLAVVVLFIILMLVGVALPGWLGWQCNVWAKVLFAIFLWIVVSGLVGLISGCKDRISQGNSFNHI